MFEAPGTLQTRAILGEETFERLGKAFGDLQLSAGKNVALERAKIEKCPLPPTTCDLG